MFYIHVIGKFGGIAYVFEKDDRGNWVQQAALVPDDVFEHESYIYGWNIGLSGNTAIVGAMTNSEKAYFAGAVYVFVRNENGEWQQQQKLTALDAEEHDYLGLEVDIDGDTILAGCQYDNANGIVDSGSVYVFVRNNGVWTLQANLVASDTSQYNKFSSSVAIEGDTAAIGAPSDESFSPGAIYIFVRSGSTWTEQQKIVPDDLAPRGNFGDSIDIRYMRHILVLLSNFGSLLECRSPYPVFFSMVAINCKVETQSFLETGETRIGKVRYMCLHATGLLGPNNKKW